MRTSSRRSTLLVPLLVVAALALAGCTQDSEPPPTTLGFTKDATTVKVELFSAASTLYSVGPEEDVQYGQNRLEGVVDLFGGPAKVEILGNVQYRSGTGPFYGFLTLSWADGSSLGFNVTGQAGKKADGVTDLSATTGFIGGTGRYVTANAVAKFSGTRDGKVGSPIVVQLTVDVKGATAGTTTTTAKGATTTTAPAGSSTTAAPTTAAPSSTSTTAAPTTTEATTTTDAP